MAPFASLPVVSIFALQRKRPRPRCRIGDDGLQECFVDIGAVGVASERPVVPGENADRPATALPDNNPGRTSAPFPGAEQVIGSGRQQKDWPRSYGKAIERSLWRKIESLRRVAQTGLRAGAREEAVLAEHYGKYRSRYQIPVVIERERHYRLDVHEPL